MTEEKGTTEIDVAKIDERAVLVYLGTGQWTASKMDRKMTADATAEAGATTGALKVTKVLLPGAEELTTIRRIVSEFRGYHYSKTTAFGRDGWALLPSKVLGDYKKTFHDAHDKWLDAVNAFITKYPELRTKAEKSLGKAYKETDYPSAESIRSKFLFDTDTRRIRESNEELLGVSDEIRKGIAAEAEQRAMEGLQVSMKDIANRISETVGNVSQVLTKSGDKAPKIYDSLIDNVRKLADELPNLNITGNDDFTRIAEQMKEKLGSVRVDDLRGNDAAAVEKRAETAETAESILEDLGGIL